MAFSPFILPGLLTPQTCRLATAYARTLHETGAMRPDKLVPGAPALYGDPLMDAILQEVLPAVQEAIGEPLLPTYSYFRVYGIQDTLPAHTDRLECEVSVSICVSTTGPTWPLIVKDSAGAVQELTAELGAGAVYAGPEHTHWRLPFEGSENIQLFVHFVRAHGDDAHLAQDGRNRLGVTHRTQLAGLGLSDHIMVVDEALSQDVIRAIFAEFTESTAWTLGSVGSGDRIDPTIRDCAVIELSKPDTLANSPARQMLDNAIFETVGALGRAYRDRFPRIRLRSDTGYNLMRYEPGGFYKEHVDHFEEAPRTLSMSIFLNDDFGGGNLTFFDGGFSVRPKPGRAVLFPANFLYPHQVTRVAGGRRYVIVTWFL
jgi:predicted 2-oxoglutarate/Fe(II)-dependent dioxygenase YbiX